MLTRTVTPAELMILAAQWQGTPRALANWLGPANCRVLSVALEAERREIRMRLQEAAAQSQRPIGSKDCARA